MEVNDVFFEMLPKIDLHGYDKDSARIAVNDFVDESLAMGYSKVVIIHGIGKGIVKKVVHEALFRNRGVLNYRLMWENIGCTLVELKNDK